MCNHKVQHCLASPSLLSLRLDGHSFLGRILRTQHYCWKKTCNSLTSESLSQRRLTKQVNSGLLDFLVILLTEFNKSASYTAFFFHTLVGTKRNPCQRLSQGNSAIRWKAPEHQASPLALLIRRLLWHWGGLIPHSLHVAKAPSRVPLSGGSGQAEQGAP